MLSYGRNEFMYVSDFNSFIIQYKGSFYNKLLRSPFLFRRRNISKDEVDKKSRTCKGESFGKSMQWKDRSPISIQTMEIVEKGCNFYL